ncbi:MAG TPA: c-type cytochrome [Conexibacter sp.]|nr:c-type cytochrome [Conexibacter sp.]
MSRALALALLGLVLALPAGCGGGGGSATDTPPRESVAHRRLMRLGASVFAQDCATCHPLLGRRNTAFHSDAPALDLDQVEPARAYVAERVQSGGVGMGGFGFDPARFRAVVAYVTEVSGRRVAVPRLSAAERAHGRALYDAQCARCHTLAGRAPTRPNPIWQATDFDHVRPSVAYVEQKVREGQREAMPSFRRRLTSAEIAAVARYLAASAR